MVKLNCSYDRLLLECFVVIFEEFVEYRWLCLWWFVEIFKYRRENARRGVFFIDGCLEIFFFC